MTIEVVRNTRYDLQTFSGDTGVVNISNLPTDRNDYIAFMEVKGNADIVKQVSLNSEASCSFEFTAGETASLGVGTFEYGIKVCTSNGEIENTYIPDLRQGNRANFIVYPERVVGTENE